MNPDLFTPVRPQRSAEERFPVQVLVNCDGTATPFARRSKGKSIRVQGYLAPSLSPHPGRFLLSGSSLAPCHLCGNIHGSAVGLLVEPSAPMSAEIAMHEPVEVSGVLSLGTASDATRDIALLDSSVTRFPPPDPAAGSDARAWLRDFIDFRSNSRPYQRPLRSAPPAIVGGPADIILTNGKIRTINRLSTTAEAVAVRDGRFIAVGSAEEVATYAGPETDILDIEGRTVVPGLIDSHIHQFYLGLNLPTVELLDARSISDVQIRIAARAAETPEGEWIIGTSGWHESLLAEGRMPTRWELDEAAPDNPVIIPRGGHVVTVNTKALERAGIDDETPDPVGGVIVRDPDSGEATGVLLESAAYFARRVAPLIPPEDEMADLLKAAMKELNSYGIVSVTDPVIDETSIAVYRRLRDEGTMTVRTELLYKAADRPATERGISAMKAETSDDMLCFAGIKFMLDGGVEGARLREPYRIVPGEQPHENYRGLLMTPPGGEKEFVECLELVAEAGMQAQTHGVGDEAIDVIIRCYAEVSEHTSIADLRWTLMHVFLPSDEAIETMRRIGVLATVQDHPVLLGHNKRRWWGDNRAHAAIPIRKLIDAGLLVGGGTDGPVVPVDPFLSMWWMVTRGTLMGYKLGEDQAISAADALELYTINNARIMGVEDERGSIEPGKLADLAVISQDIVEVESDEIRNTRALLTMVGGKIVHRVEF